MYKVRLTVLMLLAAGTLGIAVISSVVEHSDVSAQSKMIKSLDHDVLKSDKQIAVLRARVATDEVLERTEIAQIRAILHEH